MGLGRIVGAKKAHLVSIWTVRGSLVALGVLVVGSLGSGQIDVGSYGYRIPILVFLYCLIIQVVILRGSLYVLKFSQRDATTLGIE